MDADFGLDLEPGRKHGEALDETAGKHAVAGQDIAEGTAEQPGQYAGQHRIAETVATAIRRLHFRLARPDDHVELFFPEPFDQLGGGGMIIGRVAIGHDIDVGLDIGEHAADHIALALHPFGTDHGTSGARNLYGAVAAVIVIDIDDGARQRRTETRDRLSDRGFLVIAWQEDSDTKVCRQVHARISQNCINHPPA